VEVPRVAPEPEPEPNEVEEWDCTAGLFPPPVPPELLLVELLGAPLRPLAAALLILLME
jgi:hypothetical protein